MDEQDISLEDLEKSEQMLKDSLFKIGHIAGLTNDQLEADWQLLKREAHQLLRRAALAACAGARPGRLGERGRADRRRGRGPAGGSNDVHGIPRVRR